MLIIEPMLRADRARVLCGDALALLKTLSDESVHCVVTSPPYYGLRDYGVEGQLGLEQTPQDYVAALVAVFREVRRVLRDDGTLWLNLGDSYANDGKWGGHTGGKHAAVLHASPIGRNKKYTGLKPKDLIGVPWRVAFALQDDGWYLRSDIIWQKSNPMPESVTSRPTKAHEYVFLLAKSPRYYYDHIAVAQPCVKGAAGSTFTRGKTGVNGLGRQSQAPRMDHTTRNRRSVWTIPTKPYKGAHFAVFPEALAEPCILAGTSEAGCCPRCLTPYRRLVEHTPMVIARSGRREQMGEKGRTQASGTMVAPATTVTRGWEPECSCAVASSISCTVLDPFAGSGTTLAVALKHGRSAIGIELNPAYIPLIEARLAAVA